jgi:alanine racemase
MPTEACNYHRRLNASRNARDEVVTYTHFASADDITSQQTLHQLATFNALPAKGPRSAANSAGVIAWPQSHYEWVRPGYMLFGNSPMVKEHSNAQNLQPVMTLASAVISVREVPAGDTVGYGATWVAQRASRIATVTIGYGDGYPRQAPNGTPVLINGQRASLAGRVSMDMITVDVTHLTDVQIGSEVVVWGPQLPLEEIALYANTIGYELTTRMPARTPRIINRN